MIIQQKKPGTTPGAGLPVAFSFGGEIRAHLKGSPAQAKDSPTAPRPQQADCLTAARRVEALAAVQRGRGQEGLICLAAELRRRAGEVSQ
jgi:hypothetical protein